MGGTARVSWTRGTRQRTAGQHHSTSPLSFRYRVSFVRLLGSLIRSKQGPGFSRIFSELVQGSDVQLSCSFPRCQRSFWP